ncbi:hypothetical protein DSCA_63900 [Desulfosarcina alkanivorans]|uniref:Uncharacterized protein n=1 Tax=Desulfosarcina alkanivorans TaxID=571177 RepID=A0A5K7YVV5_9BACT|nr:hypothetical protein DSCA_63900 [Desulfosarcina alkanivorans]
MRVKYGNIDGVALRGAPVMCFNGPAARMARLRDIRTSSGSRRVVMMEIGFPLPARMAIGARCQCVANAIRCVR